MEKGSESKFEGESSPRKQQQMNSIKRGSNSNSSPGPLSDYSSPLKGPASIAYFFAPPPQATKLSSSSFNSSPKTPQGNNVASSQRATVQSDSHHRATVSSPHKATTASPISAPHSASPQRTIPVTPSRIPSTHLKSQIEDSESDLTLSEDEIDEEEVENKMSPPKNIVKIIDDDNDNSSTLKTLSGRGIPFNFNDEEGSTGSDDSEESEETIEHEHDTDTDISVIISLPSTDSNEPQIKPVMRRFVDFSNSEYESDGEEEEDIPISIDSNDDEDGNDNRIPDMVFNSKQIEISRSSEKKREASPQKSKPLSPKKEIVQIEPVISIPEVPLKRGIEAFENQNIKANQTIHVRQISPKRKANNISMANVVNVENKINTLNHVNVDAIPVDPVKAIPVHPVNVAHYHQTPSAPIIPIAPVPVPCTKPIQVKDVDGAVLSSAVSVAPAAPVTRKFKTGYVYDERMLHHYDHHDPEHPEKPARITSIYDKLRTAKLLECSRRIPIQVKLSEFSTEVQAIHDIKYCRMVNSTSLIKNVDELNQISSKYNSVYFNSSTAISATIAASATIELCQAIGRGDIENGFAIVRPPGHHAEHGEAMGFCIYNNCAIAASSLIRKKLARRILILDWDVHHGNGTQNAFAENADVLYISLHRYDGGKFYPYIEEANHTYVGTNAGLGKSVNVAWNGPGFGDADYMYAFSRLIMPIAREFNPDFVIVSAGFDAAAGDPIGECELTTFGYSMMLQELMTLAGGKVALVLEGGYNLEVISKCYEACVRMLLKEAPPRTSASMVASAKAISAVENSVISLSPYWKCLFPKPAILSINENTPNFPLSVILDIFWREECQKHFNLSTIPGIFKNCSESFVLKYTNRVLASEGALFAPDVLIVFAHESGPIHTGNFLSSLCLQASKINQCQPFLPLLQAAHHQSSYSFIDVNLPTRTWKIKQAALGSETESQELNILFSLLWDRLISRSGCRNVFFVASGSPIYSIGHLINTREVEAQVRGCYFFASTLFIPVINCSQARAEWYQKNSQIVVPSQEPMKKAINNAAPSFGSCFSAGQWLMADSAAAIGDFKLDILNFIRTRLQK